jgi:multiple sugar transport system ATP-binding protein
MIAGFESVSHGHILINDRIVDADPPKDRDIAMVFQSYALYPSMTVRKNIAFPLKMSKVPPAEQDAQVAKTAKLLQIEHLLDRKPAQLSGGQRQRVAMGRALVRNPSIFLFDEPLSNLDARLRIEMRTEIKKLHERLKTTIVYVTHDQIEAMTLATRIAVMKDGIVQQLADPQTTYEKPANRFVAEFVGSPPMNFIPAKVVRNAGRHYASIEQSDGGAAPVTLPVLSPSTALDSYVGKEIVVGLRPESVSLNEHKGTTAGDSDLSATVIVTEPTGSELLAVISLGGVDATIRLRPRDNVAKNKRSLFTVDMTTASYFDKDSGARI